MSTVDVLIVAAYIAFPVLLVILGYVAGKIAESRHYKSIHSREKALENTPVVTWKTLHDPRPVRHCELVLGCVVVSVDHYKRLLMAVRSIFGGESRAYASVIERARREAILRMKESAPDADLFLNARLETSTISDGSGKSLGTSEVVAYATAITFVE